MCNKCIWAQPGSKSKKPTVKVPFLTGHGDGEIMVEVLHIASDYPRDAWGTCAFCHGDPLNEAPVHNPEPSLIKAFYKRHPKAETCPMCLGRPS